MTIIIPITLFLGRILAINTLKKDKRAFAIHPHGGLKTVVEHSFDFGIGTEVEHSCSLQWRNNFYIFGGRNEKRQLSMINRVNNRLERKGSLDFDFYLGGCTVLNQTTFVLCFDFNEKDVCRQSNNSLGSVPGSFTELAKSNYEHRLTKISSFEGKKFFFWKFQAQRLRYTHRCWRSYSWSH